MSNKLDIIAVSAHPDDAELGCSGILAKYSKYGYKVGIIDLTDGEPTPYNDDPQIRIEEAQESAKILGIEKRVILDLPNRALFDTFEARVKLATAFRKYKPNLILCMGGPTPLASPDHIECKKITEAALFYSQLTKWNDKFNNTKPHKINGLLYYSTAREIIVTSELFPFIVCIDEEFEQKKRAIQAYKSQFHAYERSRSVIKWITEVATYYGSKIGKRHGEILYSPKMFQVDDLEQFF